HVRQDYAYTADGRVVVDGFGDPVFVDGAGVRLRLRAIVDGVPGDWVYTDGFDVNNNNMPVATIQGISLPPEGVANEYVRMNWTAIDLDSDPVTVAVDWAQIPDGYVVGSKTVEMLAAELDWQPAATAPVGDGTLALSASPFGVAHVFGWDSVTSAGTVSEQMLMRARPLDAKQETGQWAYMLVDFLLDNFTVFNDPGSSLPAARMEHTATTLSDGTVLVAGGAATAGGAPVTNAYLFFPGSTQTTFGSVAPTTGAMNQARRGHTATKLLAEGGASSKVLVAGGFDGSGNPRNSAEIYDPATKTFASTGTSMLSARAGHAAVLLRDGKVLLAGGKGTGGAVLDSAEIYDPLTDTFSAVDNDMYDARAFAPAVLLAGDKTGAADDGWVLLAGGEGSGGARLATIEIFDPVANEFLATDTGADLSQGRFGFTLTGTLNATWGAVAAGGMASPPVNTLERFDPVLKDWTTSAATMRTARAWHSATMLGDGSIFLLGGQTDEAGTVRTNLADIYDVDGDQMSIPNGEYYEGQRDMGGISGAALAVLPRGRVVIFGGRDTVGPTGRVLVFVPRSEDGFNYPPQAQIQTPSAPEPWSFGVRIYWRAFDREKDPVRIFAQFQIADDPNDDSANLPAEMRNRWLPATMKERTVLGQYSSGVTGLGTRQDYVTQGADPIDYPDQYPDDPSYVPNEGEHLFVWDPAADLGEAYKGDYNNAFFRVIVYGAVEGETATTGNFQITANAPVIARIQDPLVDPSTVFGNVVFPFYLQDADEDYARVVWDYGIDVNGDGYITDEDKKSPSDSSPWYPATHAAVSRTIGATTYTDADRNLETEADTNVVDGLPWGKLHHFVWDSVRDVGSPETGRTDIHIRVTAYDYPTFDNDPPNNDSTHSLGIGGTKSGFTLERDPDGLVLSSWAPVLTSASGGGYSFDGVLLDERIKFTFSAPVDPTSVSANTIKIFREGTESQVSGYYETVGSTVTFWPQVDEIPARSDIFVANTGYSVVVPGFDPADPTSPQPIVRRSGADADDTNALYLLNSTFDVMGFRTGTGVMSDTTGPLVGALTYYDSGPERFVWRISERLMPSSIAGKMQVWVRVFAGIDSVVTGTLTLTNGVDALGPYAEITLIPNPPLPADPSNDLNFELRLLTGVRDLAGNALQSMGVETVTKPKGGSTSSGSFTEDFTSSTYRDGTLTTVFWGTTPPAVYPPGTSGTNGYLTGMKDFGAGADGSLTLSTSGWTSTYISPPGQYYWALTLPRSGESSSKTEWNWSSINLPEKDPNYSYPVMIRFSGSSPITFRCAGTATINCMIYAKGGVGANGSYTTGTYSILQQHHASDRQCRK
ncbi:MAG: hypothetical protein MUE73_12885, partial [Planctomycetes bacterium]|nr:hypothetical protein [Planctomycetota bacterium]